MIAYAVMLMLSGTAIDATQPPYSGTSSVATALPSATPRACAGKAVLLSMTVGDCTPDASCTIEQPSADPAVYRIVCPCQPVATGTWRARYEVWSDWPECGGTRIW